MSHIWIKNYQANTDSLVTFVNINKNFKSYGEKNTSLYSINKCTVESKDLPTGTCKIKSGVLS